MNLDPQDSDERHALYNALFAAAGLPTPSLPVNRKNVSTKYFTYGERHLRTYRARIEAIADVVARFAAEDTK